MSSGNASVSVVMPVFNTERYVGQAVESILGQTYGDFEFIIIDDGSTDGSRRILEGYAAKDSRIRLVRRANTGLTVALNEGLALSRAEFVARMDSDDVSMPQRFARQVEFLGAHPEVVAMGGQARLIDPDGHVLGPLGQRLLDHAAIDAYQVDGRGGMIAHPAAMMRRWALERVGGYRAEFEPAEDRDLWLRLAEVGQLANVADVVLDYRVHLRSVSQMRWVRQAQMTERATMEARVRRGLEPLSSGGFVPAERSEAEMLRDWVYRAYGSRNYRTARKHAWRALCLEPGSLTSWRLFCGSCLGAVGRPVYKMLGGRS